MDAAWGLLVLIAAGVNFGWQPVEESPDGYEYIVQVEPELLDVLQSGGAVPIESNVPPAVGPIRKVSIVVGRGDVPRDTVTAIERTAYFASKEEWTPTREYQEYTVAQAGGTSTYDRYALPKSTPSANASQLPSVLDRAQAAFSESGSTLREGLEAGIQAANQRLSRTGEQVVDATRNAGQDVSRQLQGLANDPANRLQSAGNRLQSSAQQAVGATASQLQQITNPITTTNAQPTAGGVSPTRTANGWTSIGSTVAAPPLGAPELSTTMPDRSSPQLRTASGGPSFPPHGFGGDSVSRFNDRSDALPTDRASSQVVIERAGNSPPDAGSAAREPRLVPIAPLNSSGQANVPPLQQSRDTWNDPWDTDPWAQPPQRSPNAADTQGNRESTRAAQNPAMEWQLDAGAVPSISQDAGGRAANGIGGPENVAGNQKSNVPNQGTEPATTKEPQLAGPEQPPWIPLLIVSLSLMGSLSANLFLGWSYLDARQKYRALVRKTADTFRRAATSAA